MGQQLTQVAAPLAQMAGLAQTETRGTKAINLVKPREVVRFEAAAMSEALMLGTSAFYGWGKGKDRVEGPAWPLTKSLMRVYGNCSLDMDPVQETSDAWIFTARAVDHETGFSISRQFRQSKRWEVHGRFDEARKEDIRFQIGQSKALRNVALAFLPDWLVDRAMEQARGGVKEAVVKAVEAHGIEKVVARCLTRLSELGVSEERVLYTMGRKVAAAITVDDLVVIRGGITAVEKGSDTADEVFPHPPACVAPKPDGLLSRLQDAVKVEEAKAAACKPAEGQQAKPAQEGAQKPCPPQTESKATCEPAKNTSSKGGKARVPAEAAPPSAAK